LNVTGKFNFLLMHEEQQV